MGLIKVEGIKIYAYHGHLPEEAILGGHFVVNISVNTDTSKVEESDDLNDTLDYVKIIAIVKEQMSIRSSMIEHPAARIADQILLQKHVKDVKVEVEKLNVPITEIFNKISVTVERKNNNY
tara:strand:+ start:635 stop:997 length:363 start_codon:yes stop_codon:yes gene_type:complete